MCFSQYFATAHSQTWVIGAPASDRVSLDAPSGSCTEACAREGLTCVDGSWGVDDMETFREALASVSGGIPREVGTGGHPDSVCELAAAHVDSAPYMEFYPAYAPRTGTNCWMRWPQGQNSQCGLAAPTGWQSSRTVGTTTARLCRCADACELT